MQRVWNHLGYAAVGFNGSRHVKGFHGNLDLVEVLLFEQADLPEGGGDHVVDDAVIAGLGLAGLGQPIHQVHVAGKTAGPADAAHGREAAEIHADADGDITFLGSGDDLAHLVFVAQVAGIEAQAVDATLRAFQRKLVVEMDVGDQRYPDLLLDLRHRLGSFHVGHRGADDLASRFLEFVDLPDRRLDVASVGLRHRLYGDVGATANLDSADVHRFGNPALVHSHLRHRRSTKEVWRTQKPELTGDNHTRWPNAGATAG